MQTSLTVDKHTSSNSLLFVMKADSSVEKPVYKYDRAKQSNQLKSYRGKMYNDTVLQNIDMLLSSAYRYMIIINERKNGGMFITTDKSEVFKYADRFNNEHAKFKMHVKLANTVRFTIANTKFYKMQLDIKIITKSDELISQNFKNCMHTTVDHTILKFIE